MGNVIFHVDVNSAFLSWEAVFRLYHKGGKKDLRNEVAAVGGDIAMGMGLFWRNQSLPRSIGYRLESPLWKQNRNVRT